MSLHQRTGQLSHDPDGFSDRDRSPLLDQLLERIAFDIFHDDVMLIAIVSDIIHIDDIGMRKLGDGSGFSFETFQCHLIICHIRFQDLDGNFPFQYFIISKIDIRHAAFSDQFHDLVTITNVFRHVHL